MEFTSDKMLKMLQQEYDAIENFRAHGGNPQPLYEDFEIRKSFAEQVMGMNILIRQDKLEWQR